MNTQTDSKTPKASGVGSMELLHRLKPSAFKTHPWASLLKNSESETVACNIMVIRARRGDEWPLTWQQYKQEREKDEGDGCADSEDVFFRDVIKMIPDAIGAISFSPSWADAARRT